MLEEEKFKALVSEFVKNKAEYDRLQKLVDSQKIIIKQQLDLLGENDYEVDGKVVHCSVSNRITLNEEKLILRLRKYAPDTECIKTKEYIDTDVMEDEIYHEKLSPEAMSAISDCTTNKEIIRLTVKKAKVKK